MSQRIANVITTAALAVSLVTTMVAACLVVKYRHEAQQWKAEVRALLQSQPYAPAVIPARANPRVKT